jgi:glycosyltransferase involved in cell wall biosynthesis
MDPSVCIVIPTYNRANLVSRAIQSALVECMPGDEVVVVDDGSTDKTEEALRGFGTQIRVLRLPNGGAGKARNAGIAAATKELVAFLDSDDEWRPNKLKLQRALFQACPEVLFCFSDFANRGRDGQLTERFLRFWHNDPRSWDEILGPGVPYSSLVQSPGAPTFKVHIGDLSLPEMQSAYVFTSSMVARRAANDALHFAEDVGTFEDLECFGRLALRGVAAFLDHETAWQHGHSGPRLTGANSLVKATSRLTILERVWGTNARFLARYRRDYEAAIDETRRHKIRALLNAGESGSARAELAKLHGSARLADRVAAALPQWLLRRGLLLSGRGGERREEPVAPGTGRGG